MLGERKLTPNFNGLISLHCGGRSVDPCGFSAEKGRPLQGQGWTGWWLVEGYTLIILNSNHLEGGGYEVLTGARCGETGEESWVGDDGETWEVVDAEDGVLLAPWLPPAEDKEATDD
jgi:hypothetical protein